MRTNPTVLAHRLRGFLDDADILAAAAQAHYGQRKRKCPPLAFFWTLVLGLGVAGKRSLSSLRRFFLSITGATISSAAFQKRFTAPAARMFESLFVHLLGKSFPGPVGHLPRQLRHVKDVLAVDSTAFSLHDRLAKHFRGFKSEGTKAAARVTVALGLTAHRVKDVTVSSGRRSETRFFRVNRELRGYLVTFDLGFFSFRRFQALKTVGADFICRLRDGVNALITGVSLGVRARRRAIGRKLSEVRLSGPWIDLDVTVGEGRDAVALRLVGSLDASAKKYHLYLTTLPRDRFGPRDISEIYRLRWQVELLFKELKSVCRLAQIPSGKPHTARCLIFASLIIHLVSRFLGWLLLRRRPWQFSPVRWTMCILTSAWAIARSLVRHDDQELEARLTELRRTAPAECLRVNIDESMLYNVCLS